MERGHFSSYPTTLTRKQSLWAVSEGHWLTPTLSSIVDRGQPSPFPRHWSQMFIFLPCFHMSPLLGRTLYKLSQRKWPCCPDLSTALCPQPRIAFQWVGSSVLSWYGHKPRSIDSGWPSPILSVSVSVPMAAFSKTAIILLSSKSSWNPWPHYPENTQSQNQSKSMIISCIKIKETIWLNIRIHGIRASSISWNFVSNR